MVMPFQAPQLVDVVLNFNEASAGSFAEELSTSDFDAAYERVHLAAGTRTQIELAAVLGVRQSAISDAKRKKRIPTDWLRALFNSHRIDPQWILYGTSLRQIPSDTAPDAITIHKFLEKRIG